MRIMTLENYDMIASLQVLPETEPIEAEGIQFGPYLTCMYVCEQLSVRIIGTICRLGITACR
jgi:hypothetical protein